MWRAISHSPNGTNTIPVNSRSESTGVHVRNMAAHMSMKIPATSPETVGLLFIAAPPQFWPSSESFDSQ
jgi:hypothetical protein